MASINVGLKLGKETLLKKLKITVGNLGTRPEPNMKIVFFFVTTTLGSQYKPEF
jgi:hypothetical protein